MLFGFVISIPTGTVKVNVAPSTSLGPSLPAFTENETGYPGFPDCAFATPSTEYSISVYKSASFTSTSKSAVTAIPSINVQVSKPTSSPQVPLVAVLVHLCPLVSLDVPLGYKV